MIDSRKQAVLPSRAKCDLLLVAVKRSAIADALRSGGADGVLVAPPVFDGRPLIVPICGDDVDAKATVRELVAGLGCRALDVGPLHKARHIEYLAAIVIGLLFSGFEAHTVFNLITETKF